MNVDAVNDEDKKAEDFTPQSATPVQRAEIDILFRLRRGKRSEVKKDRNLLIFIANVNYDPSGLVTLKGALDDLKAVQDFLQNIFTIRTIIDQEDVLGEVQKIMESLPPASIDNCQLMYSGNTT